MFYVFGPEHRDVNEPTAMVLCSWWMTRMAIVVVERLANAGVRTSLTLPRAEQDG